MPMLAKQDVTPPDTLIGFNYATGKKTVKALEIKPEVCDPDDIEMLQDLIVSAVNEAVNQVEETTESEMSKITGGVSLPGLF